MPDAVAESVVQEAERFLKARLAEGLAARLAAKVFYIYPRHRHFQKMLNRLGNSGRNNLSGTHFVVVATHSKKAFGVAASLRKDFPSTFCH
jgi:hypothetical protein